MKYNIITPSISKNTLLPLTTLDYHEKSIKIDNAIYSDLYKFTIGKKLMYNHNSIFKVSDHVWLRHDSHYKVYPLVECLVDLPYGKYSCSVIQSGWSIACITLSDKGANGLREDLSGNAITEILNSIMELSENKRFIIADEAGILRSLITHLAYVNNFDLIITTGGTGVGPRDITPQAIAPLIDQKLPGFSQAIISASIEKTINAIISRQISGIINKTLLITLPGSLKAVTESLDVIKGALEHTLKKIHGDDSDCGG